MIPIQRTIYLLVSSLINSTRSQRCHLINLARYKVKSIVILLSVVSPQSFFAERFFAQFDADGSGYISLDELLDGLHLLTKGDPVDKLRFLFKVYDVDGKSSPRHFTHSLFVYNISRVYLTVDHTIITCGNINGIPLIKWRAQATPRPRSLKHVVDKTRGNSQVHRGPCLTGFGFFRLLFLFHFQLLQTQRDSDNED